MKLLPSSYLKIYSVIIVLAFAWVGWLFLKNKETKEVGELVTTSPSSVVSQTPMPTVSPESKNLITYTDSGYTPNTITIKKGETVIWKNESRFSMWTASAVHPTHKAYPGSGIEMCGVNTLIAIFDACKGYSPGQSWSFKFDNVGTWKYHNHVNSSHFGTITVE